MLRHWLTRYIAARLDFARYIGGNIGRPVLKLIEGNNSHRVVELAGQEICNDGFEVGPLDFGLAVGGGVAVKAINH
jgi:hypothetical protein